MSQLRDEEAQMKLHRAATEPVTMVTVITTTQCYTSDQAAQQLMLHIHT